MAWNSYPYRLGADQARHDARADPARAYLQQLEAARAWLARHGIPAIAVDYNALVGEPAAQAEAVARFLGRDAAAPDMAGAVDPALYRSRRG